MRMSLTAAVESKSEDNPLWVDVVSPEKFQTLMNLSEIGVCKCMWSECLDVLIPHSVYQDRLSISPC